MSKKLVSLALALVMLAALAVPAMADNSTTVNGTYKDVEIAVTVTQTTTAIINPYKLPVKINNPAPEASSNHVSVSGQQIVSQPMLVRNNGSVDLNVSVALSALEVGGFKLTEATATDLTASTAKTGKVYLQIMSAKTDATDGDLAGFDTLAGASEGDIYDAALEIYANGTWTNAEAAQILFTSKEVKHDNVALLIAANADEEVTDGEIGSVTNPEYNAGSVAVLRLTGEVVVSPKYPWAENADGFTAKIVYTFTPAEN